jgi:sodium/proline symporter
MSGWLLMGLPGYAYAAGMEAVWIALGLLIGTWANWRLVAKRLRILTEKMGNAITLSSYFQNRFKEDSARLRVVSAIVILVFFLIYTASGLVAGGKLFSSVFGMSYPVSLTIGTLVIIGYTFLGGFMAVCWTDFFQGILMFLALIIVPTVCAGTIGGLGVTMAELQAFNGELLNAFTYTDGSALGGLAIASLMAWGLGYFGQPHILTRFMAIDKVGELKNARRVAMTWVTFSLAAAVLIGMIGFVYMGDAMTGSNETIFIQMVESTFPTIIAGIMLAAILAAIMSTADSQLLVTSSALIEDLLKVFSKKDYTEKTLVWLGRATVIAVACLAYLLAWNPENSVLDLVAYAWAGFGASFGPVVLISLYWKKMTGNGAFAGMITGGATVLFWRNMSSGFFDLYELLPAFVLASLAIFVVSSMDQKNKIDMDFEFKEIE